jgi:hypothetical protein
MLRSQVTKINCNKASKRSAQVNAFEDLLSLCTISNNKLKRGDIKTILSGNHKQGLSCVTRLNLEFCLRLYLKGIPSLLLDSRPATEVSDAIPPVPFVEYDAISGQILGQTPPMIAKPIATSIATP